MVLSEHPLSFPLALLSLILPARPSPLLRCILRIRADDPEARVPLGLKYGAELSEGPRLLKVAKDLGLQVRSFQTLSCSSTSRPFFDLVCISIILKLAQLTRLF
jgi:hypothetical protein